MHLKDEVELLRRVPLFSHVAPGKLKLLAFTSDRVSYKPDQQIFHQGDLSDAAYVILTGKADILVDTVNGPIKIAEAKCGGIIGEIGILCDISRTASVKTTTPLEALRISKETFLKMLSDYPEMTIEIMRVLATRLSQTTAELTEERSRH